MIKIVSPRDYVALISYNLGFKNIAKNLSDCG